MRAAPATPLLDDLQAGQVDPNDIGEFIPELAAEIRSLGEKAGMRRIDDIADRCSEKELEYIGKDAFGEHRYNDLLAAEVAN